MFAYPLFGVFVGLPQRNSPTRDLFRRVDAHGMSIFDHLY